jgi:hypothetical protein
MSIPRITEILDSSARPMYKNVTGAAALATTLAPAVAFRLAEVRIHLGATGASGTLTATMDADAGSAYDLVLFSQAMASVTDFTWQPTRPMCFTAADEIDFAWANAGTKTYGLTIIYELI